MSQLPVEVEVKIAIDDPEKIRLALADIGARKTNVERQIDTYYDHPCKSFSETDEALRIRVRTPHSNAHVEMPYFGPLKEMTYKGSKLDLISKTRTEISIGLEDENNAELLLGHLGFKEVARIIKNRSFYKINDISISIDDVIDVGTFLELERLVFDESKIESARDDIFAILKRLGLDGSPSIRKSYLELLMERNP
ncbi:MAG: class IV adenylate cyclase [Candidatus Thorarchaeota archaeon]|nr:class IV adenylate cyclase [Candidatus Thorarchaeota archaeon]